MFLYKLQHNLIDCPELLQNINFKINSINSINKFVFYLKDISTNYSKNDPSNISMSASHSINYNNINIFNKSLMEFIIKSK